MSTLRAYIVVEIDDEDGFDLHIVGVEGAGKVLAERLVDILLERLNEMEDPNEL
jgi:hypothetical protein